LTSSRAFLATERSIRIDCAPPVPATMKRAAWGRTQSKSSSAEVLLVPDSQGTNTPRSIERVPSIATNAALDDAPAKVDVQGVGYARDSQAVPLQGPQAPVSTGILKCAPPISISTPKKASWGRIQSKVDAHVTPASDSFQVRPCDPRLAVLKRDENTVTEGLKRPFDDSCDFDIHPKRRAIEEGL
jgi:hypothetical protein